MSSLPIDRNFTAIGPYVYHIVLSFQSMVTGVTGDPGLPPVPVVNPVVRGLSPDRGLGPVTIHRPRGTEPPVQDPAQKPTV